MSFILQLFAIAASEAEKDEKKKTLSAWHKGLFTSFVLALSLPVFAVGGIARCACTARSGIAVCGGSTCPGRTGARAGHGAGT